MAAVDLDPDAVVVRFRPTKTEAVLSAAAKEYRRTAHYRLSVFASTAEGDEDQAGVVNRLVRAAALDSIDMAKNPKIFVCTRAEDLLRQSFTFHKEDDDAEEPPEHYSVDLGAKPEIKDVERFLSCFVTQERPG